MLDRLDRCDDFLLRPYGWWIGRASQLPKESSFKNSIFIPFFSLESVGIVVEEAVTSFSAAAVQMTADLRSMPTHARGGVHRIEWGYHGDVEVQALAFMSKWGCMLKGGGRGQSVTAIHSRNVLRVRRPSDFLKPAKDLRLHVLAFREACDLCKRKISWSTEVSCSGAQAKG